MEKIPTHLPHNEHTNLQIVQNYNLGNHKDLF
jgi:hypothetical protein